MARRTVRPVVERTCTRVLRRAEGSSTTPQPQALSAFRSEPAYVLLGDPGSGKTTAFRRESEEVGDTAIMLDARDFLTLDPTRHPEWRDKTIFIDGLDEVRAGSVDTRTPLDDVRRHLDALGSPRFRLSCREADWLGESDRSRLDAVAPGASVAVLRLDPLSRSYIERILDGHFGIDDARGFVEQARVRSIEALLTNPQTLDMLADVVAREASWPGSRRETFEMACRQMAAEHNSEHAGAGSPPPSERLLDAAGYLCMTHLVTGAAGYARRSGAAGPDYIDLAECAYPDASALDHALGTRLFTGAGDGRLAPVHRHVAEFLGARHLARRIAKGLPARRVLALISGADGAMVTEMRGLSGWLATHSGAARDLLIGRDPLGAALYGDLGAFSPDERGRLLLALSRREALHQLWREVSWVDAATALGALTAPDMEPTLAGILSDPARDPSQRQLLLLVLALLRDGSRHADLVPALLALMHDPTWPPEVGDLALGAVLHSTEEGDGWAGDLVALLEEIRAGSIADPDHEMRGALLSRLYPRTVGPGDVWEYLVGPRDTPYDVVGHYDRFWRFDLTHRSSPKDVAALLDRLAEHLPEALVTLESLWADSLPLELLARGLAAFGDDLETPRLYDWLRAAAPSPERHHDTSDEPVQVRAWLEQRPDLQKALILEGLERCRDSDRFLEDSTAVWDALHGSELPTDLASWSLEQAIELAPSRPVVAKELLDVSSRGHPHWVTDRGIGFDVLEERIRGHAVLERRLAELRDRIARRAEREALRATRLSEARDREALAREKADEETAYVRAQADALRENRAPLALLRFLGHVYFLHGNNWTRNPSPEERLLDRLGGDRDLVDAALAGLRGTVWRSDVPGVEKIIRLKQASRMHYSALPFLAGVEILDRETPERLDELDERLVRTALAFFYCSAPGFNGLPRWHARWADRSPAVVADVAARCLSTAIRHGGSYAAALDAVDRLETPDLKLEATLSVLKTFPLRAGLAKLTILDRLLWSALGFADRSRLFDLIEAKLSAKSMEVAQRVRWLAAALVAAPESSTDRLAECVRGRERRVRALAAFFGSGDSTAALPSPSYEECAQALRTLISVMGRSSAPPDSDQWVAIEPASERIERLIRRLSALPGEDAMRALDALLSDPGIAAWHDQLARARDDQRVIHRDAGYRHPDLEQLHSALEDEEPANARDLAALVLHRLHGIGSTVRTGNTDEWRQYWNEDAYGHPIKPKHEDSCRDALLARLRAMLPRGVDAQPEGQHAGRRRSDIRVSYGSFSVPLEIKKDTHREVWSAAKTQLIEQYTRDAETSGQGIFVVLWFNDGVMQAPPTGSRPSTPDELGRRLEEALTIEEAARISVIVLDVSPPTRRAAPN
ncbi:MAG: hypothetical protein F4020_01800 [Gammaproteobacteria bacterium]|nr:hypothetical protein [Gammaproteobacteria bacterium]